MKTIILIPCMDMVHTRFMRSLLLMDRAGHDLMYGIKQATLIYDSRNQLLQAAYKSGADRMLWLDSDMDLPMDTIRLLSEDIDKGCDIVSGLYFQRRPPHKPVIYSHCELQKIGPNELLPLATAYTDYPENELFEVAAFGFGCVMMTTEAAKKVTDTLGQMPFMPVGGFGEDLSYCMRARNVGLKLWCDSRVSCGHVGYKAYTAMDFDGGS